MTAQSDFIFFPVNVAVTTATDILVTVIFSALALAAAETDL